MKKSNMLNESTIRRFMKLATIDGLSDKFVADTLQEVEEELDEKRRNRDDDADPKRVKVKEAADEELDEAAEEELEEAADEELEEAADEELEEAADEELEEATEELDEMGGEMPMDRDDEMEPEMEPDMEPDAGEPDAGAMVSVDQLMSALEKALEDVLGQDVEVSQDDDEEEFDADLDLDPPDAGDELGLDADAEEEDDEELDLDEAAPEKDVVEEVYARVIQRLTQETKSNKK